MIDINKCQEILEDHFATVTREEFLANLEEFCPEFIAAGLEDSESAKIENTGIYPIPKFNSPRVPGQDKGRVTMSADFNDPLPADILDEFYNSSVFPS
jgi:hypothetical protein